MSARKVDYLLIGGGLASANCARWLREEGAEGEILLVGREPDPPYNRPDCSKTYLQGKEEREKAFFRPDEWWGEQNIELLKRTSVTALDLETLGEIAARVVRFGSGDTEPAEIDVEHELLFRLPEFWCEVFAELGTTEDPDALGEVADAWAATEEMAGSGDLRRVVRDVVGLVAQAQEAGQGVYLWVQAV